MSDRIERLAADPLADIKAKIRALRAKTSGAGCTEAEAMAAAAKVAELLARYEIDAAALDRPPIVEIGIATSGTKIAQPWRKLWATIGCSCQTKIWFHGPRVVYYGFEPDALMAEYLHEVMERYVENARAEFRATRDYLKRRTKKTRTRASQAFLAGCIDGVTLEVFSYFQDRLGTPAAVAKKAVLEAELKRQDATFRVVKSSGQNFTRHESFGAGYHAGRNVDIHNGIDGARGRPDAIGETRRLGRPTR